MPKTNRERRSRSRKRRTKTPIQRVLNYTKGGIPMIIHQIWVGGELQPILKYYTKTFKKLPGFQYKLWGMKDLTEKNFPLTWWYIKDFLTRPKIVWAKIADLMRLELLYNNGGIYVDTTMEYIGNIDIITNSTAKFIMSNEEPCGLACRGTDNRLFISNSFIASV